MRVAICYDWLDSRGGAERIIAVLLECYPNAELFSLAWKKSDTASFENKVHTLPTKWLPTFIWKRSVMGLWSWLCWRFFDFSRFDFVIAVTSDQAKLPGEKNFLCICLTPPRHLYEYFHQYCNANDLGWLTRCLLRVVGTPLRVVDFYKTIDCKRVVAISVEVQKRLDRAYGIDAMIIYPPV